MRFDEPDVREAYRRGARDCLEALASGITTRRVREIKKWLGELEAWQDDEPPSPPTA